VKVAATEIPTGVPEITPVVVLKDNPVGSAGLIENEVADPVSLGDTALTATPRIKYIGVVYERADGAEGGGGEDPPVLPALLPPPPPPPPQPARARANVGINIAGNLRIGQRCPKKILVTIRRSVMVRIPFVIIVYRPSLATLARQMGTLKGAF
jgi:hypothetical protein